MGSDDKIRDFVRLLLEDRSHYEKTTDSQSLINSGFLDSLAVLHIVAFMEQEFGIDFSELYFDQEDFETVESMISFVEKNRPAPRLRTS